MQHSEQDKELEFRYGSHADHLTYISNQIKAVGMDGVGTVMLVVA